MTNERDLVGQTPARTIVQCTPAELLRAETFKDAGAKRHALWI